MPPVRQGQLYRLDGLPEISRLSNILAAGDGVVISGFPIDAEILLTFLTGIGQPCLAYSKLIPGERQAESLGFNIVKVRSSGAQSERTHHRGGALVPHTARSWARVRPRYFAMLMVEPGWRDRPKGQNGESLLVPWRAALARMRQSDPSAFETAFGLLVDTPLEFQADNVREPVSNLPIVYRLPDQLDQWDCGFRVKEDLPERLRKMGAANGLAEAVEWLQASAAHVARGQLTSLEAGDLVLVDNNRWAHGRCAFETARSDTLSPREVWSVTLA